MAVEGERLARALLRLGFYHRCTCCARYNLIVSADSFRGIRSLENLETYAWRLRSLMLIIQTTQTIHCSWTNILSNSRSHPTPPSQPSRRTKHPQNLLHTPISHQILPETTNFKPSITLRKLLPPSSVMSRIILMHSLIKAAMES